MKKTLSQILSIMLLSFSLITKAQQKDLPLPFNSDTSVLKIPNPKLTWIDNHNHFDIYQATPDNMYVIKPDTTKHFNMPNAAKSGIIRTPIKPPKKDY
jgi:hypothetical protein